MNLLILVTLLFTSISALASGPCGGKDFCYENPTWKSVFTSEGVYYAKGAGKSCDDAFKDAQQNLDHHFDQLTCDERGRIKCGTNGAPYRWNEGFGPTCFKQANGTHVVWAQCDNLTSSWSGKATPANRCMMVGNGRVGRLVCGGI